MGTETYSDGAMQGAIDMMHNQYKTFDDTLETLMSQLRGSLAEWEANAQQQYAQVQAQWNQEAQHLGQVMTTTVSTMRQISQGYVGTDKKIASDWDSVY